MNIQDIISTIINYIKNMNKKDLIIFSLVFYTLYKTKTIEKNTDLNETNIREQIKSVYQADVQAIKNLGDLASKMINVEGNTLTLPYNVKIEGSLVSTNTIEAKSWIGGRQGVYSDNKNIYLTWVSDGPKLTANDDGDITIPGNVKIEGNLNLQKDDKKFRIALDSGNSVMMQTNQPNVQFGPYLGDTDKDITDGNWTNSGGPIVRGYNLIFRNNIESEGSEGSEGSIVAKYIKSKGDIEANSVKTKSLDIKTDNAPYVIKGDGTDFVIQYAGYDSIRHTHFWKDHTNTSKKTIIIPEGTKLYLGDQNPLYMNINDTKKKHVNSNGSHWAHAIR